MLSRMMSVFLNVFSSLCLWLLLMGIASADVKLSAGRINADFNGMTLSAALSEIADLTGIEISASAALNQKLAVGYHDITAEALLKDLLRQQNAMYLHNPQTGRLQKVRVFGIGKAVVSKKAPSKESRRENQQENNDKIAIADHQNGKYYLSMMLNGRSERLLVDTGATSLVLSESLARRLGLVFGSSTRVLTAAGEASGYQTVVDEVQIAQTRLKGISAYVLPNLPEDGLVGHNVLAHFHISISNDGMHLTPLSDRPQEDTAVSDKGKISSKTRQLADGERNPPGK